jgi:hypothetical protein
MGLPKSVRQNLLAEFRKSLRHLAVAIAGLELVEEVFDHVGGVVNNIHNFSFFGDLKIINLQQGERVSLENRLFYPFAGEVEVSFLESESSEFGVSSSDSDVSDSFLSEFGVGWHSSAFELSLFLVDRHTSSCCPSFVS